jgi:hypothetical protein
MSGEPVTKMNPEVESTVAQFFYAVTPHFYWSAHYPDDELMH